MKKTVFFILITITACAFGRQTIFAQTGLALETEIKKIEILASKQGISAVERHDALVSLARLRQLSGDIEGAAKNWFSAAGAIPDKLDEDALLSCAYCLSAMGEWDRAITALEPLLLKSQRARFLYATVKAIKTDDLSELVSLADNPDYSQTKVEILFVLWKLTNGESSTQWRQRLVNEFPQTPEGRLATGNSSAIVKPSPFWLLASGLDSLPILASEKQSGTVVAKATNVQTTATQATPVAQTTTVKSSTPVAQASQSSSPQTAVSTVKLQTGIYSRQDNAQAQVAKLKQAGFTSAIEQRIVNGKEMWVVTVSANTDQGSAINELRSAGFESFPVK